MNKTTSKIYPWVVVALLWGVALLNYMDRQMLSTMKESMQLDISELQTAENFGRLMAVFLWIYGLMSPFAGAIADRVNRKWLIVISLFVWSAVTYGMGYANTFTEIYWLRALMGVSEALYIPAGLSLIADWHSDKSRSLAVGIHMTGLYTGQAIGGFGATVAASYTWHTAFHWFGLIGIAYALLLVLCLRENPNHNVVKPAVETNKVEKDFQYRCLLDYLVLLRCSESTRMGNKELVAHTFLRKPQSSDGRSRSNVNHHHCTFVVLWCSCRWNTIRSLGTTQH